MAYSLVTEAFRRAQLCPPAVANITQSAVVVELEFPVRYYYLLLELEQRAPSLTELNPPPIFRDGKSSTIREAEGW